MRYLYEFLVVRPAYLLYRSGPSSLGFGFWNGMEDEDICYTLSGHTSEFWRVHAADCEDVIEKNFKKFRVTMEILLYFYLLFKICSLLTVSALNSYRTEFGEREQKLVLFGFYPRQ